MRIAVFSDLHADLIAPKSHRREVLAAIAAYLDGLAVDVVLFCGDMVNHASTLEEVLAPLAVGRLANLYVEGNHDVWVSAKDLSRGWTSFAAQGALARAATRAGWHYLPGQPVEIDGWGFAGSLGWYDYGFAHPLVPANEQAYRNKRFGDNVWNDVKYAHFIERGPGGTLYPGDPELAARFTAELAVDLAALGVTPAGGGPPTIVGTHTLPYRELVLYKGQVSWDFYAAFMGTPQLGELYDALPDVRGIFAGHTHVPRYFETGDERVIGVAPFGYTFEDFPADPASRILVFETDGRRLVRLAGGGLLR